jgi:hypothetical protein
LLDDRDIPTFVQLVNPLVTESAGARPNTSGKEYN